ncbi:MAG: hypothetical protein PHX61_00985 [Alphaproteobacteria bacterium]|nr:hypothetical protein [Alphaproteobacteria bacterium]
MEEKIKVVFELSKSEIQAIGFILGEEIPEDVMSTLLKDEIIADYTLLSEDAKQLKIMIGCAAIMTVMKPNK